MVLLGGGGALEKWGLVEGSEVTRGASLEILEFWLALILSGLPLPFLPPEGL